MAKFLGLNVIVMAIIFGVISGLLGREVGEAAWFTFLIVCGSYCGIFAYGIFRFGPQSASPIVGGLLACAAVLIVGFTVLDLAGLR